MVLFFILFKDQKETQHTSKMVILKTYKEVIERMTTQKSLTGKCRAEKGKMDIILQKA